MCVCGGAHVDLFVSVCAHVYLYVFTGVRVFPVLLCIYVCTSVCVCVVLMVTKEQMSRGKGKSDEAKVNQATGLFQTQARPSSTGGGAVTTSLSGRAL